MLTDSAFIRRLDSLYLLSRKVLGGSLQADRRTTKKGTGITFADYAEYYFGADYRSIDWRVFARFESLVIKLFELEEDATIYILLDCSRSMQSKFLFARQLSSSFGLHRFEQPGPLGGVRSIQLARAVARAMPRARQSTAVPPVVGRRDNSPG